MSFQKYECMGNYDFKNIVRHAIKRFIDGYGTIELLQQARTIKELEEIALVCMLDVEDEVVERISLSCKHAGECKVTDCRIMLKNMIEKELQH